MFKIPFIIDLQDPWRNDYYLGKPVSERPRKFLISYKINSLLEKYTIPRSDGVISVSNGYVKMILNRYPKMHSSRFKTIPFGASHNDFKISRIYLSDFSMRDFNIDCKNIVYIGRGGYDMHFSITAFLKSVAKIIVNQNQPPGKIHIWFIGTSYSPSKEISLKIKEIALNLGIDEYVSEISSRLSFYETLTILKKAYILLAIGSEDKNYTASKICQYILAERPMISIFHEDSDVVKILRSTNAGEICSFDDKLSESELISKVHWALTKMLDCGYTYIKHNENALKTYLDEAMTEEQTAFFNEFMCK